MYRPHGQLTGIYTPFRVQILTEQTDIYSIYIIIIVQRSSQYQLQNGLFSTRGATNLPPKNTPFVTAVTAALGHTGLFTKYIIPHGLILTTCTLRLSW